MTSDVRDWLRWLNEGWCCRCLIRRTLPKRYGSPVVSTFPAVHGPASSLVPYAFLLHVNRIDRRIWPLVTACTAIWSGRKNAAYTALVGALLKQAPIRIQDVGLEGYRLRHPRSRRTLASSQLCCRYIQLRLAAELPRSNICYADHF